MGLRGPKKGMVYKKTLEAEEIRAYWRKRLGEEQEGLFQAMLDKAKGCAIIDKKDDTGEKIYDLPPDAAAFRALVEHAIGKPKESVDLTSKGGQLFSPLTDEQLALLKPKQ